MTEANTIVSANGRKRCRACRQAADLRRYRRHKERRNAATRTLYRERYRDGRRAHQLLTKFGMTQADYDALLAKQGGGCAICSAVEPGDRWNQHLHVDHDHETGAVRGLLCQFCNVMLGNGRDDPELLREGAAYIEGNRP